MKTRNHNLLYFAFLSPSSLDIEISLPGKFTTWSWGWGQASPLRRGSTEASKEDLVGKLKIGCGYFSMADTTSKSDEILFSIQG